MLLVSIHKGTPDEMRISDGKNIVRQIPLISGERYMINSIVGQRNKKNGRIVIFHELMSTPNKATAKVIYVDTKRPGKVYIGDLDHIPAEPLAVKDAIKLSSEPGKEDLYEEFLPFFQLYLDILNLIDTRKNDNNIAAISQKAISDHLQVSPSNVSKKIKHLVRYGAIEQLKPGVYKLINCSIWYTPYRVVHQLNKLLNEQPELIDSSYKEQAAVLDVSIQDIFQAWAYFDSTERYKKGE